MDGAVCLADTRAAGMTAAAAAAAARWHHIAARATLLLQLLQLPVASPRVEG